MFSQQQNNLFLYKLYQFVTVVLAHIYMCRCRWVLLKTFIVAVGLVSLSVQQVYAGATFQAYYCRCSCTVLGRHTCGNTVCKYCLLFLPAKRKLTTQSPPNSNISVGATQCSRGREVKAIVLIGMGPYRIYSTPGPGRKGNSFDRYGTLHKLQCFRGEEGRVIIVWELTVFQVRGRKGNSMGPYRVLQVW